MSGAAVARPIAAASASGWWSDGQGRIHVHDRAIPGAPFGWPVVVPALTPAGAEDKAQTAARLLAAGLDFPGGLPAATATLMTAQTRQKPAPRWAVVRAASADELALYLSVGWEPIGSDAGGTLLRRRDGVVSSEAFF